MTLTDVGLLSQPVLAGLAFIAALAVDDSRRSAIAGTLNALLGLATAATGVGALLGEPGSLTFATGIPGIAHLGQLALAPDRLGGIFLVVVGVVGALSAWFGVGYAHGATATRAAWAAYPIFLWGMSIVPAAGDAVTFLLGWELMALGSTVLLHSEHATRPQVRSAVLWYAAMTHLSFVLLLAGFAVLIASANGTTWEALAASPPTGVSASLAFVLLAGGFATKAGLVPVHVWLPRAHPEAPSHVSAAMSAAMVKLGIYGLLLVTLRLLPDGPRWWAIGLLVLGGVSAVYGILEASVTSDLKRLLAFSTTENLGLMVTGLAVAMMLRSTGQRAVADVALVAVVLLVISHAAFKTVLFLGAGSILHATGERDLDRLGGLARRMPRTAFATSIGALAAAALPISSGFVAEWVLLQSLVHGDTRGPTADRVIAIALPITVAVVALTAGLALLTFVKVVGIAFLARGRSLEATNAHENPASMTVPMWVGAGLVLGLGLVPGWVAMVAAAAVGASGIEPAGLAGVALPSVNALLDPVSLVLMSLAVAVPIAVITVRAARKAPRRTVDLPWGCGGVRVDPTMQYTATSYAEPLVRIFDDALRPTRDLDVTHTVESDYLVREVAYRQRMVDQVERGLYEPVIRLLWRIGDQARRLQDGSVHRYLGFSFAALVVVLLVVTW